MIKGFVFVLLALFVFAHCTVVSILAAERTQTGDGVKRSLRGNNEATQDERTPTNFAELHKKIYWRWQNTPLENLPRVKKVVISTDTEGLPYVMETLGPLPEEKKTSKKPIRAQKTTTHVSKKKIKRNTRQVKASHKGVPHSYDAVVPSEALNPMGPRVNSLKDTVPMKAADKPTTSGQTILQKKLQSAVDLFRPRLIDLSSIDDKIERLRHELGLQYDQNKYPFMALGSLLLGGKTPALGDNSPKKDRAVFLVLLYFDSMDSMPLKNLIMDKDLKPEIVEQNMQWLVQETKDPGMHLDMLAHMAAGDQLFVKFEEASSAMPGTGV